MTRIHNESIYTGQAVQGNASYQADEIQLDFHGKPAGMYLVQILAGGEVLGAERILVY